MLVIDKLIYHKITNFEYMFHKQKQTVKLKIPIFNLKKFVCVENNTFVIMGQFQNQQVLQLIHVDSDGNILKILKQFSSQTEIHDITMLGNEEFIYIYSQNQQNKIEIISLKNYKIHTLKHQKKCRQPCTINHSQDKLQYVHNFPKTNNIAIFQKSDNRQSLRITFYDKNQIWEQIIQPLTQYCFEGKGIHVNQINDHSKIAVCSQEKGQCLWVTFLDCRGLIYTLKNIDFGVVFSQFDSFSDIHLTLFQLQSQSNYFFLISSYEDAEGIIIENKFGSLTAHKDKESYHSTIKQRSFQTKQIPKNALIMERLNNFWVFYGYYIMTGNYSQPIYFFAQQNHQFIRVDHQQAGIECISEEFIFKENTVVRIQIIKPEELVITKTTMVSRFTVRQITMQMLLHINQDFDDDLLMDSLDFLI